MKQTAFKTPIPEGYEIDEDRSTLANIVYRKKQKAKIWEDLVGNKIPIKSTYIGPDSCFLGSTFLKIHPLFESTDKDVFIDERHAKSALAMAQISQLMPYYGGAITDEEWIKCDIDKYTIGRRMNNAYSEITGESYQFIAFHTKEQRDRFLKYNKQLIKDYLMLNLL